MTFIKSNRTKNIIENSARFSVAPMMDWTDKHCRYLHRKFTNRSLLYTEMVAAAALVHGKAYHLLDYCNEEHPLALQLGGSDPIQLAEAAAFAKKAPQRAAQWAAQAKIEVAPPAPKKPGSAFFCAWYDFNFRFVPRLCRFVTRLVCKWRDFCKSLVTSRFCRDRYI